MACLIVRRNRLKLKRAARNTIRLLLSSRKIRIGAAVVLVLCLIYFLLSIHYDNINRLSTMRYIESVLNEAYSEGDVSCEIPILDPYDPEITQFDKPAPNITCAGFDWVRCHLHRCRIRKEISSSYKNIVCTYRDIIHVNDSHYWLGETKKVFNNDVHVLNVSDHVKIACVGKRLNEMFFTKWKGHAVGFRPLVVGQGPSASHPGPSASDPGPSASHPGPSASHPGSSASHPGPSASHPGSSASHPGPSASHPGPTASPPGPDDLNILMLGFDSTSRNSFIRHMPNSYRRLAELGAVVLHGYNIVGGGTAAALFPILFGRSFHGQEVGRETMRNSPVKKTLDSLTNLFNILKGRGYRTLYFEDSPWIGTFQYRFYGFDKQPADHYIRSFFQEETDHGKLWHKGGGERYCVGDTPTYLLLMNKTKEFFEQDGKKFAFTFIADITHDDHNMIGAADDDTAAFLEWIKSSGLLENTLVIVFGDHGPSFSEARSAFVGRLEERLPLMSVILPRKLKQDRPSAVSSLARNAKVLTTPFDIHLTVLDAVRVAPSWNPEALNTRVTRGRSLLRPIPRNRTCWEAEVEPHWCVCVRWENISDTNPMYHRAAGALVERINRLITPHRQKCAFRSLSSVQYVMRRRANKDLMSLEHQFHPAGFGYENRVRHAAVLSEVITVKLTTTPGDAVYEATLVYRKQTDSFEVDWHAVQRTNAYGHEPDCISDIDRRLNPFCYCMENP